ncbi:hypothetical protein [Streptomyces sp. bgisy027]|uniref:hypothetical protein n=1 Tax=Streptomyces sp. bgisy027 TaxID=3413770 RepID=UPI003D74C58D
METYVPALPPFVSSSPPLALLGARTGATVPQTGPMARARPVALARRAGARDAFAVD